MKNKVLSVLIIIAVMVTVLSPAGKVTAAGNSSIQTAVQKLIGPLVTGLPFAIGETWYFTQNFHGDVNAMDFQTTTGQPGRVLAADSGTVWFSPANSTCIMIDRGDGISLGYQHIEPGDIAKFKAGDYVNKGQFIGMTTTTPGCNGSTKGAVGVVHFWAQGAARFEVGSVMGGFSVGSICGNAPSLNKDGVKYCPIGKITYTGDSAPVPPPPPATVFNNGVSRLWQDGNWLRANLTITASNLNGQNICVHFWRGGRDFGTKCQRATSNTITFWDLDAAGYMNGKTTYYSQAAMNQNPNPGWPAPNCAGPTGGQGLCDSIYRP